MQQGDSSQDTNRLRQAKLVDAFLAAARAGDFAALLAVLDPDVVLRADETAVQFGQPQETRGTEGVLTTEPLGRPGAARAGRPPASLLCSRWSEIQGAARS